MEVHEANGWELSKENIQPLSSGRKMSFLTHSLDRTDEAEGTQSRDWDAYICDYDGPDPLEPWLKYIEYIEQSSTTGGQLSAKYDTILNRCFQTFRFDSQYMNDKRLVEVYLKALQNLSPVKRAGLIQDAVSREFGTHVSKMYLAMSNAYEALENYQEASKVLKNGIEVGAQPVEYLEDELKNLQYRVAERIAKRMQDGNDEPLRNFGMSVPVCHLTNEAQNIRMALSPSKQCRARPVQQKITPKVPIFQGFDDENMDTDSKVQNKEQFLSPSKEAELKGNEQENVMKPKKWCHEMMPPPPTAFTPSNLPPVEIYVEEPEIQPKKDHRRIAKGVLSERKVEEDATSSFARGQEKAYRKSQIIQGRNREITFEHLRAKEYMKKVGVSTLKALVSVQKPTNPKMYERPRSPIRTLKQETNQDTSKLTGENAELKKSLEEAEKRNAELSVALQQNYSTVLELKELTTTLRNALDEESKHVGALKSERSHLIKQLRSQEEAKYRAEQELAEFAKQLTQERHLVEKLMSEKELMRQQFEEEKTRMQQEFERERNESLLSFRLEHHRSVHVDEEKLISFTSEAHKDSPVRAKSAAPVVPIPAATSDKLGFTLYESNMETNNENAKGDKQYRNGPFGDNGGALWSNLSHMASLNTNDDCFMPPPPPKEPRFVEEDKENVAIDGNRTSKQGRALTGILQPSKTAEPMELICTEDEDEEEEGDIIVPQPDFNVTDLTRALQLYPRPLGNSTPGKTNTDHTCGLSPSSFLPRPALGSIDIRNLDLEGAGGEDDCRGDMEPIIYEDDPHTIAGKSHGLSMHPNLSPIPETSKERWSSCTSSSSSTNMTTTRGTVNFSHGSSYSAHKFAPRRFAPQPQQQRKQGDATY